MSFYAVKKGRQPGIFSTWAECEKQVKGFSGAAYKKFKSKTEAENFIGDHSTTSTATTKCFKSSAKRSRSSLEEAIEQRRIEELLREALENEEMLPSSSKKQKNNDYKIPPAQLKKYGNHYFQEDKHGYVQVFTDGSCENNGKKHAIAGLGVYFGDDHPLNASEAILGKATNNIGEIKASIEAISSAQKAGVTKLNIFTDSKFLINSVCNWMTKWKENNWTLASGKAVINQEDFKVLDKLISSGKMLIKWSYVPAHRGHYGNEQADRLAKEGARKQIS